MRALSVISRVRLAGGSPGVVQDALHRRDNLGVVDLAGRQVDLDRARGPPNGRRADMHSCRHASLQTQAPMGMIRPLSSATGMNRLGATSPCSGCSQRNSASTPTARAPWISTTGW